MTEIVVAVTDEDTEYKTIMMKERRCAKADENKAAFTPDTLYPDTSIPGEQLVSVYMSMDTCT